MNKNRLKRMWEAAAAYGECGACENNCNLDVPVEKLNYGTRPKIALVVDAPNPHGELFNPPVKALMEEIAGMANSGWDDFYVFAAFRCPLKYSHALSGDRILDNAQYCRGRARRILGAIRPKGVLLMGSVAAKFFGDYGKSFTMAVAPPKKPVYTVPVRVAYHPSYFFMSGRNGAVKNAIASDLGKILKEAKKRGKK